MLGSFTSGLFGGASDAVDLMNKWQTLKQNTIETQKQQLTMNAAKGIKTAMDTPGADQTGTAPSRAIGTTGMGAQILQAINPVYGSAP